MEPSQIERYVRDGLKGQSAVVAAGLLGAFLGPLAAAGSVVIQAGFGVWNDVKIRRILDEFNRQVQILDVSKVDRDWLASEQYFDLCRQVIETCVRTSEREKVAMSVRVLLQSVQAPPYRECAQEYESLLASLSTSERHLLAACYRFQRDLPRNESFDAIFQRISTGVAADELTSQYPGMTTSLIESYLLQLSSRGLLINPGVHTMGYVGGRYFLTDYMRNLMAYLDTHDLSSVWEGSENER